jgi:hypothetical protein
MSAPKRKPRVTVPSTHPNQIMIAGSVPVSLGERLTWAAQQPMQPKQAQRQLDIGFWDQMRAQLELF